MKKGVFITCPGLEGISYKHPWAGRDTVYNNREIDICPQKGLLTVMKCFDTASRVRSATLRITSLGIFEALVNGKRVGVGDAYDELAPLWTDYTHRVFEYEYDILPYLKKKGGNVFTARVSPGWWSGRISFGYYGFKPTALCAEIELVYTDGKSELIASDTDFQAAVAGPVLFADIWDGEYFDARIPDPAVSPESVDWCRAAAFTDFSCEIVPFEGEPVRVNEYVSPISATVWRGTKKNGSEYGAVRVLKKRVGDDCESLDLKAGQHLTLDLGENLVGRPAIAIRATDGATVSCLFAEMLNDSGDPSRGNDGPEGSIYIKNYRSALARLKYVAASENSRKQLNIFRPLHTFYGFRYIELTADRDITVECVTAEVLGSRLSPLGEFKCSDAEVNKLYANVRRGMLGNYLSVPTDCPQRDERLGWTGDTQIFCGAASYIADTDRFLRKWLGDARDSQLGYGGEYCDVIPRVFGGKGHGGNAAWGDAGLIVPYKLYLMYGDVGVIEENYAAMESYMDYLSQYGLEGPHTAYGDWLNYEVTDKRYIAVCYYAYDAFIMAEASELAGRSDRAKYYRELRERIVAYYKEKYVQDGEITEKTQTGYLLPLAFDMVEGELYTKTVRLLKEKIADNGYTLSTGFVGTGILNQTLSKVGLDKTAYSLLLNTRDPSWLYSVRQGATTVWERWNSYTKDKGFGNVGMNSFNHYAYGAVAEWMYAYMAGIRPDPESPGFNGRVILAPRPDTRTDGELPSGQSRITSVSARYGEITSEWAYENGRFVWHFTVPDGTAKVEFPRLYAQKEVEINGARFNIDELGGTVEDTKLVFELSAGRYTLK